VWHRLRATALTIDKASQGQNRIGFIPTYLPFTAYQMVSRSLPPSIAQTSSARRATSRWWHKPPQLAVSFILQPSGCALSRNEQCKTQPKKKSPTALTNSGNRRVSPRAGIKEFYHQAEQELRNEDKSSPLRTPESHIEGDGER
jgi:hypothetical protein